MLKNSNINLKSIVIPAKRSASGNPAECKALNTAGCSIRSGMTRGSESGRSMVEMLGVLAIIGVLSVAGIAGYSIAMRSYRTNEIVNAASMFYVLAKAQNAGNGPSGNIGYADVGGTNPSGATLTYTDNAFTITFTDIDDCTMAANKLGDKATADCDNKKITVNFGEAVAEPEITTRSECLAANRYWIESQALAEDGSSYGGDVCLKTAEEGPSYCAQFSFSWGAYTQFVCNPNDPHDCVCG